jgi:hypothetical protein
MWIDEHEFRAQARDVGDAYDHVNSLSAVE